MVLSKKRAKPKYISSVIGTSITACPNAISAPAHGDFRLLTRVTPNISPGIITPDNEITTTLNKIGSIKVLQVVSW
jgi:hypothetical protein